MQEYIEREYALDRLYEEGWLNDGVSKTLYAITPADVVERKRGKWVENVDNVWWEGSDSRFCSCCGQAVNVECVPWFKFCSNCGADMRGD